MKSLRLIVSGTVQGVFFRAFVKENADKLGIKGYVRNLDNGTVEVIIEGKDSEVKEMVEVCKKGPAHADIKNVKVEDLHFQGFKEFKLSRL